MSKQVKKKQSHLSKWIITIIAFLFLFAVTFLLGHIFRGY